MDIRKISVLKISGLFHQDQDQDFFFKTKTFISRPRPFSCPWGTSRPRPGSRDYIPGSGG